MTYQEAIEERNEAQKRFRAAYEGGESKGVLDPLRAEVHEACKRVDEAAELPEGSESEFIKFDRYFNEDKELEVYFPADGFKSDAKSYKSAAVAEGLCKRLLKGDEYIGGVTFEYFVITPDPFEDGWRIFYK